MSKILPGASNSVLGNSAPGRLSSALANPLPCHLVPGDLWFSELPAELEQAKAHCQQCPIRMACLAGALDRAEPYGVWGGEIFHQGAIVARKRSRGRPRKTRSDVGEATAAA